MSTFQVTQKEQVVIVRCPPHMDLAAAEELCKLVQGWIETPSKLYILDCGDTSILEISLYRPVILFNQSLKKTGSFLFTVNLKKEVAHQIHSAGLDNVFNPKKNVEEAMNAAGIKVSKSSSTMDVNFVNPFVKATQNTLEVQANTKIAAGKPFLKKEELPGIDIAGVISLTSKAFQGSIALCFPAKVFLAIYNNLTGEKVETITKETEDAAGEILNIIFGQAKAELNEREDYQIQKAIPTIVRGGGLKVHHLSRNVAIVLPFTTDAGPFHIEVSMDTQ